MRFADSLRRFRQSLRRPPSRRPEKFQARPRVEQLEDRMVPSTLNVDALGNAVYSGSSGIANNVTLSERPLILPPPPGTATPTLFLFERIITDKAETITVTGPGASRWGGSGTNQVVTLQPVKSLLVDLFNGNEAVNVHNIDYATEVRHNGPGLATVNAGNAGRLQGLQGPLVVDAVGVGSSVHLNVDDSADSPQKVLLGPNVIQFAGVASPITFLAGTSSVDVFGGADDTYFDNTLSAVTPVIVHGTGAANTLVSGPGINDWAITGVNAGSLRNVSFTDVQNLRGGPSSLRDTFHFNNGAGVTGSIIGAGIPGSIATLDYSKYTTPVIVDLKLNLAFAGGIKTFVFNIQDVFGGQGNNILVGNGNNLLRAGSGRDILISGGGNSTLLAGAGEDILIGAHYIFDTNLAALNALMAQWSAPLPYALRVNNLILSGALSPLTVVPQPGVTTLVSSAGTPGAGLDFLIIDPGDVLAKAPRLGEKILFV
jgi:Ca2+-binding RTX toxin-like protein